MSKAVPTETYATKAIEEINLLKMEKNLANLNANRGFAAKDATIEDLSRKLEEARGRIAELEARLEQIDLEKADRLVQALEPFEVIRQQNDELAAKDARIAELEAAIKPFAAVGADLIAPDDTILASTVCNGVEVNAGHCRAAHRAMIKAEKE